MPMFLCHLESTENNNFCLKIHPRAGRMAQQVNALSTNPGDLSLTPGPHMVEGENGPPVLSSDLHVLPVSCVLAHRPPNNK